VSTQPISDERLAEIRKTLYAWADRTVTPEASEFDVGLYIADVRYLLAALVAVRAECDRLVTVKEAAEQVIRDYPPHEYGCEWSEYSPSFGALREALAAVSSPGEETP
jgi:hypothetical protein